MCIRRWCQLYYLVGSHVRRQVWYTLVLLVLTGSSVLAFAETPSEATMSPSNLIALATAVISLVFAAGSVREQFADLRERVTKLERRLDIDVPAVYVRKDVYDARNE